MHSLIRISWILKAGVAKNPVSELMSGVLWDGTSTKCSVTFGVSHLKGLRSFLYTCSQNRQSTKVQNHENINFV